jgi:BolA family transcriptional regulator, general stress-responsive regulator
MQVEKKIRERLTEALAPECLVVRNDSHKHAHHRDTHGVAATGDTHFSVMIVAQAFAGRSRVERHRMVYQALAGEIAAGVHALAVKAYAPGEDADAA